MLKKLIQIIAYALGVVVFASLILALFIGSAIQQSERSSQQMAQVVEVNE